MKISTTCFAVSEFSYNFFRAAVVIQIVYKHAPNLEFSVRSANSIEGVSRKLNVLELIFLDFVSHVAT